MGDQAGPAKDVRLFKVAQAPAEASHLNIPEKTSLSISNKNNNSPVSDRLTPLARQHCAFISVPLQHPSGECCLPSKGQGPAMVCPSMAAGIRAF